MPGSGALFVVGCEVLVRTSWGFGFLLVELVFANTEGLAVL